MWQSGLTREKWDEVHFADGSTYGERTIERALRRVDEVYEPDAGGGELAGSKRPSPMASGSEPGDETTRAEPDESVYLEERNRLLREKVRTQHATIEEQAARIDKLERELEAARQEPRAGAQPDDPQHERGSPWARLSAWFGIS